MIQRKGYVILSDVIRDLDLPANEFVAELLKFVENTFKDRKLEFPGKGQAHIFIPLKDEKVLGIHWDSVNNMYYIKKELFKLFDKYLSKVYGKLPRLNPVGYARKLKCREL